MTPAIGSAINNPVKPNRVPPANSANIIHSGCSFILLPTNFGVIKFPSSICPIKNIANVTIMWVVSNPNW